MVELIRFIFSTCFAPGQRSEESISHRSSKFWREILALKLLQKNLQKVEVAAAQMQCGALVTVKVEQRGRVSRALSFQVERLRRCCGNRRHKRVDSFDRVIHQQSPLRDHMMSAALVTSQQLHQIEALANHVFLRIKAMIGNNNQRGFRSHGTLLDRRPYL